MILRLIHAYLCVTEDLPGVFISYATTENLKQNSNSNGL